MPNNRNLLVFDRNEAKKTAKCGIRLIYCKCNLETLPAITHDRTLRRVLYFSFALGNKTKEQLRAIQVIKKSKQTRSTSSEAKVDYAIVHVALLTLGNAEKAAGQAGFFKTGKGQYGEGDRFLGTNVPAVRALAKQFSGLGIKDCERLLQSPYNDVRFLALILLVEHYRKGDDAMKELVYQTFLKNRHRVNNWNLVDSSASYILGTHLLGRDRSILYELAESKSLWDRRIAVVATFAFIRENDFADILKLTEKLLGDKHDLMHKACGWMLREVGKRNSSVLEKFIQKHRAIMPRTMLRYAIERFSPAKRKEFLAKN